jgi:DNA end-binding protein Ku
MPRPIWKGVITFGMVSIPVGMYAATESKDVSFNQLHKPCNSRIRQRRWCPVCQSDVTTDEIVKGYEYAKDQYVIVEDSDFESLPVPSKQTIELSAFVDAAEIDPIFHEKTYYIEPDQIGVKAYALLLKALEAKELTALAKIAIRTKERLCAVRPKDGYLVVDTLFWPDEIRIESAPHIPDVLVNDRELAMANSLIEMLTEEFEPGKFGDTYREALLGVIERKVQGSEAVEAPQPTAAAPNVTDLMAALKASVEAVQKRKPEMAAEKVA